MKTTFALLIASCLIATSVTAQAEDQHQSRAGKQVQLAAHYDGASARHERRQKHESRREDRREDRQDHKHHRAQYPHDRHAARHPYYHHQGHYRSSYYHQPYAQIYVRPHFGWSIHGGY